MNGPLNIPNKLEGAYLKAYVDIGNRLASDQTIQAAILSNSLINTVPDTNSDLDIVAITNQNYWQRKQLSIQGVFVEIFFYSETELVRSFDNGDYQDMHMVGYGFEMFDKSNCIKKIKEKAKMMFEKGPGVPDHERTTYLKYLVWDNYCDVTDILSKDTVGAVALMHKSVWYAVEVLFSLNGRWFCKPKKLLLSVETLDNQISSLLKDFYMIDSRHVDDLYKIYCRIISKIIAPYKLDEHFIWNSSKHQGTFKLL
jgi:hypothetical protein